MKNLFQPAFTMPQAIRALQENKLGDLRGLYETKIETRTGESGDYTVEVQVPTPISQIVVGLADSLEKNTSLRTLDLTRQGGLNQDSFCMLLSVLIKRKSILERLYFTGNSFSELISCPTRTKTRDPDRMGELMGTIPVRELYLNHCNLENNDEFKIIVEGLVNNRYLQTLDMSNNRLKNLGVSLVAEKLLLKEGKSLNELIMQSGLRSLDVSNNGHGNKAADSIRGAIEHNWSIRKIKLKRTTYNFVKRYNLDAGITTITERNNKVAALPIETLYVIRFLLEVSHQPSLRGFATPLLSLIVAYSCEELGVLMTGNRLEMLVDSALRYDFRLELMSVEATDSIEKIVAKHKFQTPVLFNQNNRFSIWGLSPDGKWQLTQDLDSTKLSEFKFSNKRTTVHSIGISSNALLEIQKGHFYQPTPLADLKSLIESLSKKGFFKSLAEGKRDSQRDSSVSRSSYFSKS